MNRIPFPFTAIVGQDKAKAALIYNLINPRIGGVLLCGEKGTAKSTMIRSLSSLIGKRVIELPVSVTEDRLIGGIDIEVAIKTGEQIFIPGLLKEANDGILYSDEVNLLPDGIVNALLDVLESGINRVEREGISYIYETNFCLIGTMNPEEGMLRPQLLDRFGLYVAMSGEQDEKKRKKIIKHILAFEQNPMSFYLNNKKNEDILSKRIEGAKALIKEVIVGNSEYAIACELAEEAGVAGYRAQLAILHTAIAIAAWNSRTYIQFNDLKEAAEFALPHRRNEKTSRQKPSTSNEEIQSQSQEDRKSKGSERQNKPNNEEVSRDLPTISPDSLGDQRELERGTIDQLDQGRNVYQIRPLEKFYKDRMARKGSGRRNKTISACRRGRYIRYTSSHEKIQDIAIDATLRIAASRQFARIHQEGRIVILKSDICTKIRESRTGMDIVFAVDASGSMGVAKRMKETKEAILSLLMDAYQRRDKVGVVAFRKASADVLLPFTRSVELAQRKLQYLLTGGSTPLAQGLSMAYKLILQERCKNKESLPLLVLITDGRANYRSAEISPIEEALLEARRIARNQIKTIVIDTEKQFITLGLARTLAQEMGATYYKVEELQAKVLSDLIREFSLIE